MSKYAIVTACALLLGSGCFTQPWRGAAQDKRVCKDAPDESQLLACRRAELNASALGVGARYERLLADYAREEPELGRLLASAHAAWLRYREESCQLETYYTQGGVGHEAYRAECLAGKNRERISYYDRMLARP